MASGYKMLALDAFDDGVQAWTTSIPQSGCSITELTRGGGLLRISTPRGTNGDWYGAGGSPGGENSPMIYGEIPEYPVVRYTAKLVGLTRTGGATTAIGCLTLWADRDNAFKLDFENTTGGTSDIVANTSSSRSSFSHSGLPLYARLTFSRLADTIVAEYSNNGTTWTTTYTWTAPLAFTPTRIGITAINWDTLPGVDADFDYLMIETVAYALQYRPIPTVQTAALDPLAVRSIRDIADGMNNAKAFACIDKPWSYAWPPTGLVNSNESGERVLAIVAPRYIPEGYGTLQVTAGHKRNSGTGHVVFRLYSHAKLYSGANSNTLNTALLDGRYHSAVICNANATAHNIAYTETLQIRRDGSGKNWLLLTAQSNDNASIARLTTLDITPLLGEVAIDSVGLL